MPNRRRVGGKEGVGIIGGGVENSSKVNKWRSWNKLGVGKFLRI